MKHLLITLLFCSLTMCSKKAPISESQSEVTEIKQPIAKITIAKVTIGQDLTDDWLRHGDEIIEIETPIKIKDLIEKLDIQPKILGDYYQVSNNSLFALVLDHNNEEQLLCLIEKDYGFRPFENKLIHLKDGGRLYIGQLSR